MTTLLLTHPDCARHDPGGGHPENPGRLAAVLGALEAERFAHLDRRKAPRAERHRLEAVHEAGYVQAVLASVPGEGAPAVFLDGDTAVSAGSGEAALRAAGAVCAAVDAVALGEVRNAFCAVRPPGHHALRARAMGFCLFNNVAVGALHARATHGLKRVAILDFDVHHGNGTQELCERDPEIFFASSHQSPCYPGTGREDERGLGNLVNAELRPGSGGGPFRAAWERRILPAAQAFAPDLVIVSAGFDAHRLDPLADLALDEDDFAWVSRRICELADACCAGRVVASLEGGYDPGALGRSVAAHVAALMAG